MCGRFCLLFIYNFLLFTIFAYYFSNSTPNTVLIKENQVGSLSELAVKYQLILEWPSEILKQTQKFQEFMPSLLNDSYLPYLGSKTKEGRNL
jgi:hypothetical protein